jgi:hypothetical protein
MWLMLMGNIRSQDKAGHQLTSAGHAACRVMLRRMHVAVTCSSGLVTSASAAGSAASSTAAAALGCVLHSVTSSFSAWADKLKSEWTQ